MSSSTISTAIREVRAGIEPGDRVRTPAGGDKPAIDKQPGLAEALEELAPPNAARQPDIDPALNAQPYELDRDLKAQGLPPRPNYCADRCTRWR